MYSLPKNSSIPTGITHLITVYCCFYLICSWHDNYRGDTTINISSKIENLLTWYEIEISHSLLKNFHHERERKTKMEYPPSLELKEEEVPF